MPSRPIRTLLGLSAIVASALAGAALAVVVRTGDAQRDIAASTTRAPSTAGRERAAAHAEERDARPERGEHSAPMTTTPAATPRTIRWIAAGGGPTPEYNQLSVEDDLALFADTLGAADGMLFFAGGPGTRSVQAVSYTHLTLPTNREV